MAGKYGTNYAETEALLAAHGAWEGDAGAKADMEESLNEMLPGELHELARMAKTLSSAARRIRERKLREVS